MSDDEIGNRITLCNLQNVCFISSVPLSYDETVFIDHDLGRVPVHIKYDNPSMDKVREKARLIN